MSVSATAAPPVSPTSLASRTACEGSLRPDTGAQRAMMRPDRDTLAVTTGCAHLGDGNAVKDQWTGRLGERRRHPPEAPRLT